MQTCYEDHVTQDQGKTKTTSVKTKTKTTITINVKTTGWNRKANNEKMSPCNVVLQGMYILIM